MPKYKSKSSLKGQIKKKKSINKRSEDVKEINPDIYKKGMCDAFAIALHRLLKKPIYVVRGFFIEDEEEYYEDCHLVIKFNKDNYLDVEGIKKKKELLSQCRFYREDIHRVDLIEVSEEEAKFLMTMEGVSEKDIIQAQNFIRENISKYYLKIIY